MKIRGLPLSELRDLAEITLTVAGAAQAGVFRALAEGPGSPADIAGRAGLSPRAVAVLLPVLEELGLVSSHGDVFAPTEAARLHLCDPSADTYLAGGLPHWIENVRDWTHLNDVLTSGDPIRGGEKRRVDTGLRRFMSAMAAAPKERVERIVAACLARRPGARTVLDVGGGPGHMARGFVTAGMEATLFDTSETVDFVGREWGLDSLEGLTLAGGDFNEDPLPEGPFDIVLMSNIVHIYGPERNRALVRKAAGVTAPAGVAAIGDFVRGRSGRAARFALVMLMKTDEGNTYTQAEMEGWLADAGYGDLRTEDVDEDRQLVTGVLGART